MARKLPPRYKSGPKKGQFKPKAARRRKSSSTRKRRTRRNPGRTVAKRRRSPARKRTTKRRTYRRNPARSKRMDVVGTFVDGVTEAGQIIVGKAAVRSIPDLAGLPKQGNMGLAIQAATAVGIGYVADMFLSRDAARAMTAGALTAPLETLIVSYRVPWLSGALAPTTANASLNAYVRGAPGLGRYAKRSAIPAPAGSAARGLGRYATERGMTHAYGSSRN